MLADLRPISSLSAQDLSPALPSESKRKPPRPSGQSQGRCALQPERTTLTALRSKARNPTASSLMQKLATLGPDIVAKPRSPCPSDLAAAPGHPAIAHETKVTGVPLGHSCLRGKGSATHPERRDAAPRHSPSDVKPRPRPTDRKGATPRLGATAFRHSVPLPRSDQRHAFDPKPIPATLQPKGQTPDPPVADDARAFLGFPSNGAAPKNILPDSDGDLLPAHGRTSAATRPKPRLASPSIPSKALLPDFRPKGQSVPAVNRMRDPRSELDLDPKAIVLSWPPNPSENTRPTTEPAEWMPGDRAEPPGRGCPSGRVALNQDLNPSLPLPSQPHGRRLRGSTADVVLQERQWASA